MDQAHVNQVAQVNPILIPIGHQLHANQACQGDDLFARFQHFALVHGGRRQRILRSNFLSRPQQMNALARVGIGAFEEAEGYPRGSLLRLLFGDTSYIGVEGRAVADAVAADPDAAETYALNIDEKIHVRDIGQVHNFPKTDVVINSITITESD